jgi:hypothetical protein
MSCQDIQQLPTGYAPEENLICVIEPAATTSPELSTARHENCTGLGEVNVRKLR